jgi:hypothetical protein
MGRVIEDVQGEGDVYEGEKRLGEASYRITVYQKTETVKSFGPSGSREVDVLQQITGAVNVKLPLNDFDLLGKVLTLHLEDGRRWDFILGKHAAQNSGKGIYAP